MGIDFLAESSAWYPSSGIGCETLLEDNYEYETSKNKDSLTGL